MNTNKIKAREIYLQDHFGSEIIREESHVSTDIISFKFRISEIRTIITIILIPTWQDNAVFDHSRPAIFLSGGILTATTNREFQPALDPKYISILS